MSFLDADDPSLSATTDLAVARRFVVAGDVDPGAEEHRRAVLEFIDSNTDALHRTNTRGHLTGSAVVFDAAAERVVLLHHRKLRRWLQPGGHADGDGNLAGVALREATEETAIDGLRIDPVAVDVDIHEVETGRDTAHLHLDVRFIVVAPPGAEVVGNHESTDIAWVAMDDLDAYDPDDGTYRMIDHARRRLAGV